MLDDSKHIIGVDADDLSKMILENIDNGSKIKFGGNIICFSEITSLIYNEDTRSLYSADSVGDLLKYKINTAGKTCEKVRIYLNFGKDGITSSHRFMHFVFFGWSSGKITVLDLSTDELLPGHLQTSIGYISSLQVCVKNQNEIYLAVSGCKPDYSNEKTDLFDISGLIPNDSVISQKKYFESPNNPDEKIREERITIESEEEKIKNLTQERDSYKEKYNEIQSKYNDLKKKYDSLLDLNSYLTKAYETIKIKSETNNQQLQKKISILYNNKIEKQTTIINNKESLIGKRSFDEIDPLVTIRKMRENTQEEKDLNKHYQNKIYDVISHRIVAEKKTREVRIELDTVKSQLTTIREVVGNK